MESGFFVITFAQLIPVLLIFTFLVILSLIYMRMIYERLRDKCDSMDEQLRRVQRKVFDVDV